MTQRDVTVFPGGLRGIVKAPPSKSYTHRALICAALADGTSRIFGAGRSEDITATLSGVEAAGATVMRTGDELRVTGLSLLACGPDERLVDCAESGSTLRFLIPIFAALGIPARFVGRGRLGQRPLDAYETIFRQQGMKLERSDGGLDLRIGGRLKPAVFSLEGNVSSQYVTGLLMALPLLDGTSRIDLTTPLESRDYVAMTQQVMERFGVTFQPTGEGYTVAGGQGYRPTEYTVEGDYSQAAFYLCAAAMGAPIGVSGLPRTSLQADAAIVPLLEQMGCQMTWQGDRLFCQSEELQGIAADVSQCPDIVPVLAAAACVARGRTTLHNAGRLRLKECDRLAATAELMTALGADIRVQKDDLIICGRPQLRGGVTVDGYGDHRMVMTAAVAALLCEKPVTIQGAQAVSKSYPNFFEDFTMLGGVVR